MALRRSRRFLNLKTAYDDAQAWVQEGTPASNVDIVLLPPETVDDVSDEEDIDDNLTTSGADQLGESARDTPGEVEVQIDDEEDEDEEPEQRGSKRKRGQSVPVWKKNEEFEKVMTSDPPEPLHRSHPELTIMPPYEIFCLFLDEELSNLFIVQSEVYAKSKNNHTFQLDDAKLRRFIGINYLSGYHQLPKESLYWCQDEDVHTPIVRLAMTRTEFKSIKQYLHVADNSKLNTEDRMAKVRPLLDLVNKKLLQFGVFSESLVVDEQMVPYYGGHPSKMCIRLKPIRFGYKKWILASDTGYPFQMDVYQGKRGSTSPKTPLGTRVVMQFVNLLEDPSKHQLFIDNLFTSHSLMVQLQDKSLKCTGTVRPNRTNKCPLLNDKAFKKKQRGAIDYRCDGKVKLL